MTEPINEELIARLRQNAEWLHKDREGVLSDLCEEAADRLATLTSEPSEAMIEAGVSTARVFDCEMSREFISSIYLAMQRAETSG